MHDYLNDPYGIICLEQAKQCKTGVGFGAVFVKNSAILGIGRNRLATPYDREMLSHVDYAIHAEQSAILDAITKGYDVYDGNVYVLGICISGKNKGRLTTREEIVFICRKCPHTFIRYNVSVNIPHIDGWRAISPSDSLVIGTKLSNKGVWKDFCTV